MAEVEDALAAALTVVLEAAERLGFPRDRLIVGIVGDETDDGGFWYETHVGRADGWDLAIQLNLVAKDLALEANEQAVAYAGSETCPACGSQRYVVRHRKLPGNRLGGRYECMDCDHHGDDR